MRHDDARAVLAKRFLNTCSGPHSRLTLLVGLLTLPATVTARVEPLVTIPLFAAIRGVHETAARMGPGVGLPAVWAHGIADGVLKAIECEWCLLLLLSHSVSSWAFIAYALLYGRFLVGLGIGHSQP